MKIIQKVGASSIAFNIQSVACEFKSNHKRDTKWKKKMKMKKKNESETLSELKI